MTNRIGAGMGPLVLGGCLVVIAVAATVQLHDGVARAMGTLGLIFGEAIVFYVGYGILTRMVRPATHVLGGSH